MDFYSFAPIAAVLDVAYTAVTALSSSLTPLAGVTSAAIAILIITLLVRAVLIPVGVSQVRAEFTRRRLAPKLQELQRRYKKNPELLQRKTMELYSAEKASPLAGFLPTLAQAPVLSVVYGLFILGSINGHPNALLTEQLFEVPLGTSLFASGLVWPDLAVFLALLAVIAGVSWGSRVVALRFAQEAGAATDATPAALQKLTGAMSWLPFITVVFAAIVPLAATLYLMVTTAWTLAERVILRKILAPRSDRTE